jgi:hypothetical protein
MALDEEPDTDMETTRRPSPWRARAMAAAALAALALAMGCQNAAVDDAPTREVTPSRTQRTAPAGQEVRRPGGRSLRGFAPGATLRQTPDLLADLEGQVGPQTAARLRGARDAGRAFAQRLGVEGLDAQGIADVLTELAYDVARAEQAGGAGSDERTSAVQRAAVDALDGLRRLIPGTALPEAEREITQWTGDVPVTFSHPSAVEQAPLP